jgi:hypothetical protein
MGRTTRGVLKSQLGLRGLTVTGIQLDDVAGQPKKYRVPIVEKELRISIRTA